MKTKDGRDYENYSENIVRDYFAEISQYAVLTPGEEHDLFVRYRNGDDANKVFQNKPEEAE